MSAKEVIRAYSFEDAVLSTEAGRIKNAVQRDMKDFNARGIQPENLEHFQTTIDDFNNYPTDDELQGTATSATEAKDALAATLKVQIRPIRNMAELQYHSTGKYKTFGFEGMDKLSDANLYRAALRIVRVGIKLQSELAGRGLTTTMLTDL